MKGIDINVDLGEGFNNEELIMPFISSVNIACGGHAGDSKTMNQVVRLAKKYNVRVGAHPSFVDAKNFGRKKLETSLTELRLQISNQVHSLIEIASSEEVIVQYIKPHGALYHLVSNDLNYARLLIDLIKEEFIGMSLMGLPNSLLSKECESNGINFISEGFADRVYEETGALRGREKAESVWENIEAVKGQVSGLVDSYVNCYGGKQIKLKVDSICFHGDHRDSVFLINEIVNELKSKGVEIRS